MTHEIFMTAVVHGDDTIKARAFLAGYTEMRERHRFTRVRHQTRQEFGIKGLPSIKELQKERGPNAQVWQELHQIFMKQSYTMQERADVTDEALTALSNGSPTTLSEGKMRRLWFTDLPDVISARNPPTNTQRKVIEIADPRMDKILAQNKFVTKSDFIEESYHWWHNGLEYALVQTLPLPPGTDANVVPNMAGITPMLPFSLLFVRIRVESSPERMQQAHAQLEAARRALVGVFEFKVFDRRCHDTRNIEPRQV
ncbi:hypothetical protein V8F20_011181 [Naviculisporaceae sp. PSN 640]